MRLRVALIVAAGLAAAGCDDGRPRTAPVSGTVTYRGKAVPNGTVMFVPAAGPAATGEIRPDGTYTLTTFEPNDGAVLGPHAIMVTALQSTEGRLAETMLPPPIVPNRYMNTTTSGLTAEVVEGPNTVDLKLTDDPAPKK